jgi:hypothetical protein
MGRSSSSRSSPCSPLGGAHGEPVLLPARELKVPEPSQTLQFERPWDRLVLAKSVRKLSARSGVSKKFWGQGCSHGARPATARRRVQPLRCASTRRQVEQSLAATYSAGYQSAMAGESGSPSAMFIWPRKASGHLLATRAERTFHLASGNALSLQRSNVPLTESACYWSAPPSPA